MSREFEEKFDITMNALGIAITMVGGSLVAFIVVAYSIGYYFGF